MSDIIIRKASIDDIDELVEMYRNLHNTLEHFGLPYNLNEETIEDVLLIKLKARTCVFFVAELKNKVVGFISADIALIDRKLKHNENNIMGHIKELYIYPEASRLGIATMLSSIAEDWLIDSGATIVECNVLEDNVAANNFWKSKEYKVLAKIYFKNIFKKD